MTVCFLLQTTDANGRLIIKLLEPPPAAVGFYPTKPGFVPLRVYWATVPSAVMPKSITIPMEPVKVFVGTIRNEEGGPIPDVVSPFTTWGNGKKRNAVDGAHERRFGKSARAEYRSCAYLEEF